ncbi:MAG: hypothetical protein O7I42_13150, partial [Alphaproteobacteria bacterium]|nr:hypothetical protein [Alphaproteobacteria bacterium]
MRDIASHAPRLKAMGRPKALGSRPYGSLSALLGITTIDRHAGLGVEVIAISTDDQERTRQTKESWGLEKVAIG